MMKTLIAAMRSKTLSAAATLRQNMRVLWSDHVIWTRDYIVAAVADQPDQQAAAARLMKNQEDIGAAVATYYGQAPGAALTHRRSSEQGQPTLATGDPGRDDEYAPLDHDRRSRRQADEELGADVRALDEVYRHILEMSDALSDGIVRQFLNRF
jgi:hypothetical protein